MMMMIMMLYFVSLFDIVLHTPRKINDVLC